ncbi:YceD family protein [Rhodobaculum claviforme]|uniref:DUF177 domain-containing protein n=1 Tax=Rhodobaculum claviforme TaxID=1549854 RepID=A0A934TM84_9RHOB|nr:DUF177 domain-containing protein [Rhodobaculum claviforme]MBK5928375.1 hypothetical protein [Rhodobaculum claviforme]
MNNETATVSVPLGISHPLSVARLPRRRPTQFDIRPDGAALAEIAGLVGLSDLRKMRFTGTLSPEGAAGWVLSAQLGATVVQPCGVTLAPVTTRLDEAVVRRYLPDLTLPDAAEAELPEDVDAEPLGSVIDPSAVMIEALALAVPDFPRAPGATVGEAVFTAPGATPMRDADARPMAQLAALRDRMTKG